MFVALAFPPDEKTNPQDKHAGHGGSDSVGALLRLDQKTLSVEARCDVDQNPGDVVLTHDGKRVLVTHFDMRRAMQKAKAGAATSAMYARLVVLDAKTLDVIAARAVCVAPHGIAITEDDRTAVIACYGSDEIALVDLSSKDLPTTHVPIAIAGGVPGAPRFGPYSVAIARDGRRALVADLESSDVRVIDLAARQFLADSTIALGARAMMPEIAGDNEALVPLQGPDGVARVDFAKGAITRARFVRCRMQESARGAHRTRRTRVRRVRRRSRRARRGDRNRSEDARDRQTLDRRRLSGRDRLREVISRARDRLFEERDRQTCVVGSACERARFFDAPTRFGDVSSRFGNASAAPSRHAARASARSR